MGERPRRPSQGRFARACAPKKSPRRTGDTWLPAKPLLSMNHSLRIVCLCLLGWIPAGSAATTFTLPAPQLLGDYVDAGDFRFGAVALAPSVSGTFRVELHLDVESLCDDPACDFPVDQNLVQPSLRSGPLRGRSNLVLTGGLPVNGAVGAIPVFLQLGGPPTPEDCDAGSGRRRCPSNGSITYNGFWGAASAGSPTLESPARVAAASIVLIAVPEPAGLVLAATGLAAFWRRARRNALAP